MHAQYMPAKIFWKCVSISLAIFVAVMWIIITIVSSIEYADLVKENKWRTYRHNLYAAALEDTPAPPGEYTFRAVAQYLAENIDEFDAIVAREKRITETTRYDSERTTLHVQNPKYFPLILVSMSKDEMWQRMRNDAESLGVLKQLLRKERSVPALELVPVFQRLPSWWSLSIFIPQFLAFGIYLIRWVNVENEWVGGTRVVRKEFGLSRRYHWCDFSWPVRLSMAVVLPGALPLVIIAIVGSILCSIPTRFNARRERIHTEATIAHGGGEQLYTLLRAKLRKGGG